jgi:hypothetical protein
MRNIFVFVASLVGITLFSLGLSSCEKLDNNNNKLTLSAQEQADLLFMREEEKLARDVYFYFYEKYDLNLFNNISSSEQQHMDAVLTLLNIYDIVDVALPQYGEFSDPDLQELYNTLITNGDVSLLNALKVGATIEDVDIKDLMDAMERTTNMDLVDTYEKLICGSRNHMRAFVGELENRGETYTPQFISQELFEEIINGSHEHCGN